MKETRKVMKELFEMGDEYKQKLYSEDPLKPCRLYTSRPTYATDGNLHLWRDSFIHPCHPLDQWQHLWPQNPTKYRYICNLFFPTKIIELLIFKKYHHYPAYTFIYII